MLVVSCNDWAQIRRAKEKVVAALNGMQASSFAEVEIPRVQVDFASETLTWRRSVAQRVPPLARQLPSALWRVRLANGPLILKRSARKAREKA